MRSIGKSVWWEDAGSHYVPSQRFGVFRNIERRETADNAEPLLHFCWITERGFVNYNLRNKTIESRTPVCPPIVC